ncbi:Serine/threonine-protein kinase SRPK3 [Termitomyces sp. J132]|nr:Serine/threonine-protein kinase SRPK3 [Termitomyces sp. J132]
MSQLLLTLRNVFGRKSANLSTCSASTLPVIIHRKSNPEPQHRYEQGGYHPLSPGEVLHQRYKAIRKLGWGQYSTVWLVRDIQTQNLAALKILISDLSMRSKSGCWDELGLLKLIRECNPKSQGYAHLCQLLDSFTHQGPNGNHVCLVMEAMSLSALDVYRALPGAMPIPLLKRLSRHILFGLQYLHECEIIHTDIKGDNILIAGVPPEEEQDDIQLSTDSLMSTSFKLSDFGAANMMSNRFAELIQPVSLRSPEVLIGADWDTKTDIWNLGCIIYEFARGSKLSDPFWDNEGSGLNPPQTHLAQIVGLCGNFPLELLKRGKKSGQYFDDQDQYSISLEDLLSRARHSAQDVRETAHFLSRMLVIDPNERWSAAQMLNHPWLKHVD